MLDARTRLIETAVRPLSGDAEIKLASKEILGSLVEPEAKGAEEAIARWEAELPAQIAQSVANPRSRR